MKTKCNIMFHSLVQFKSLISQKYKLSYKKSKNIMDYKNLIVPIYYIMYKCNNAV